MKTRKPTKKEITSIGKKVSPIVDSIFKTFVKHDLDDDIVINVCFSMVFRIIMMFGMDKVDTLKIIDDMYEKLKNEDG